MNRIRCLLLAIVLVCAQDDVKMEPNVPFTAEITAGESQYLKFYYEHTSKDMALVFSITSPDVQFYISSKSKCSPVTAECAQYSGSHDRLVHLRGKDIKEGTYSILIEATQSAHYSFTVFVENAKDVNVVKLSEGEPYRSELHPGVKDGDIAYFQFEVDFDAKYEGDVAVRTSKPDIQLNVVGAQYKLAVTMKSGEELPSMEDFDLITLTGSLILEPSDKHNYQREGIYSVAVEFVQHDTLEKIDENTNVPFMITFSTSRTIKYLNMNQPVYDTILPGKASTYFFLVDESVPIPLFSKKKQLLLSRQHLFPADAKIRTYLCAEPKRHDENSYELSLRKVHESTYEIDDSTLKKLCGEAAKNSTSSSDGANYQEICEVFVFIENHSETSARFSLTIWNPDRPIELHEGRSQKYNLDSIEEGHSVVFQYQPVSYVNEVQIIMQSYFGEMSYTIVLLDLSKKGDQAQVDSFEAPAHNTHSKTISATAFESCRPSCMLKITVTPKHLDVISEDNQKIKRTIDYDDTFTIVVSQKFLDIVAGQHMEVVVSPHQPRYFLYTDVRGIVEDTANTLIITLHEFIGKGAMCISFSDDEQLRMPFRSGQKSCDFEVLGNRLELGSRNVTELLGSAQLSLDNNPVLIIEVSSFSNQFKPEAASKFEILVEKSNQASKQILVGTPYRLQIGERQNTTLSYFNYLGEDIEIQITRVSGFAWLTIEYCLDDSDSTCTSRPVPDVQGLFLTGQSQTNLVIGATSKSFCVFCTYRLTFSTQEQISLLALVTVTSPSQFVRLTQGVTFLDYLNGSDKSNLYRVAYDTRHQIEISVKVQEGNPELYIGTKPGFKVGKYEYGPFTVDKFKQQLGLSPSDPDYFEAILPPRQHLVDNQEKYNLTALVDLGSHFVEDDLYILVRPQSGTGVNYTILVSQGTAGSSNALEDGILTTAALSRMKPSTTFFYYHLSQTQPLLIVRASLLPGADMDLQKVLTVNARVSPGDDHTNTSPSDPVTVELQLFQVHKNQLAYRLPTTTGLYEITITNNIAMLNHESGGVQIGFDKAGNIRPQIFTMPNYIFGQNYQDRLVLDVAVNSQDVFLLETDTWINGYIKPQQANFYEMYIPHKGALALSLQNCDGDLKLSYTRHYDAFLAEQFDSSSLSLSGFTLDTVIDVEAGPFYISIHSNTERDSMYNLVSMFRSSEAELPHGRLLLGGDGMIQWNIHNEDPDAIDISFKPLKCLQCDLTTQTSSSVVYEIMWSTQEVYLNMLGKCGATQYLKLAKENHSQYGEVATVTHDLTETATLSHTINVDLQSESQQLFVSVRAVVTKFEGRPLADYKLFYQNVQVGLPKNVLYFYKHKKEEFALGIAILIIFIFAMMFFICYFYRRLRSLRKVQVELELEKKMAKAFQGRDDPKIEKQSTYGQLEEEQESNL